jgi:hypothetical protein
MLLCACCCGVDAAVCMLLWCLHSVVLLLARSKQAALLLLLACCYCCCCAADTCVHAPVFCFWSVIFRCPHSGLAAALHMHVRSPGVARQPLTSHHEPPHNHRWSVGGERSVLQGLLTLHSSESWRACRQHWPALVCRSLPSQRSTPTTFSSRNSHSGMRARLSLLPATTLERLNSGCQWTDTLRN